MECIQCSSEVTSEYCPKCGQRANVKRLTLRDTMDDLWNSVIGLDGIFLRTLKDLTRRPGTVAKSYIKGIRFRYFGPVGYFFFMITLLLLWVSALGMDFADLIREQQEEISISQRSRESVNYMTKLLTDNIKWFLFLAVPFQAVAARYIFFRKSGYNLVEHSVPLFYVSGHLFWLTMLGFLYRKLSDQNVTIVDTILSLIYFGFVYSDLMRYQSRVKSFLKGIGVYIGGQIVFVLALIIVVLIVVLVLAWLNPEALKQMKS